MAVLRAGNAMPFVPHRSATSSDPREQPAGSFSSVPSEWRTPNRTDRVDDCIELHFDFADVAECCFQHDSPMGAEAWPIYHCITATHSPAGICSRSAGTTR